jgi:hypothetical protein
LNVNERLLENENVYEQGIPWKSADNIEAKNEDLCNVFIEIQIYFFERISKFNIPHSA